MRLAQLHVGSNVPLESQLFTYLKKQSHVFNDSSLLAGITKKPCSQTSILLLCRCNRILYLRMSESFYQALVLFIPFAIAFFVIARKRTRPSMEKKIVYEIKTRLFAESPTFVVEDLMLQQSAGGFYIFHVEGLVASLTSGNLEMRVVKGSHSGKDFLEWNYQQPQPIDLRSQYTDLYTPS